MNSRWLALGFGFGLVACSGGGSNNPSDAGSGGDGNVTNADGGNTNTDAGNHTDDSGVAPISGIRIFYSDLESGPSSGGQDGKGAFVTIYGNGFGASRGTSTVSIGAGAADNYPIWTNTKIAFQLGVAAASGNIVVHVAGKGDSNGVPFTVRAGNIYFASKSGSDKAAGSYTAPFQTIVAAKDKLKPGDIAYVMDGVTATTEDDYSAALSIQTAGTAGNPLALVAYPGATVTIGGSPEFGMRTPNISATRDHWVFAGFKIRANEGVSVTWSDDWRIVANDLSCPNGGGLSACFETNGATNVKFYGNEVHDAGQDTKYYHGVYFSTDSNHIDVGWNHVHHITGCRGIQFHSSPVDSSSGYNQFDLHVHDNVVHDTRCDGINMASIDPSKGPVEVYDNVVYHVGTGPDPSDGSAGYACIYFADINNAGPQGQGASEVYSNTLYDCGSGSTSGGAVNKYGDPSMTVHLRNNLIVQLKGEAYLASTNGGGVGQMSGSNNLYFGLGAAPTQTTANVSQDPKLVAPSTFDFHLQAGSPAIDTGVAVSSLLTDFDGTLRPQGAAFDIGAYERTP